MAYNSNSDNAHQSNTENSDIIQLNMEENGNFNIPNSLFVGDAELSREGQDLILKFSEGNNFSVEGYFTQENEILIQDSNGGILNESLVNSFLESTPEYAQKSSITDESPVGAIEEIKGSAKVIRVSGETEEVTLGTPVYEGDVIQTSENGAVNIMFIDETSMAISDSARIAIDKYEFDPSTENGVTDLSVLKGVFVYTSGLIGRDDPDDIKIDTPVGSIGIRGTIIAGNIKSEGDSEISVLEGAIVVTNGTGEITLSEQYETVQLSGFENKIELKGVEAANDISKTYGSVSDVLPQLFSSINDNIKTESKSDVKQETAKEGVEASEEIIEEPTEEPEANANDDIILDQNEEIFANNENSNGSDNVETEAGQRNQNSKNETSNQEVRNDFGRNRVEEPLFRTRTEEANISSSVEPINPEPEEPTDELIGEFNDFDGNGTNDFVRIESNGDVQIKDIIDSDESLFTLSNHDYSSVAFVGDINNDGYADVVAGTKFANSNAGKIGIINGANSETSVSVDYINNPSPNTGDKFGSSVSGIGDFDGDGKSDFIIGAVDNNNDGGNDLAGSVFIYTTTTEDFTQIRGVAASGTAENLDFGRSVSDIGDFNGDGFSDILVGSNEAATIIFGGNTAINSGINHDTLGMRGFSINVSPVALSSAGDFNGDGFDDIAISVNNGTLNGVNTYIVYGHGGTPSDFTSINNLNNIDNALNLGTENITTGQNYQITALGDDNGDGFDDISYGVTGGEYTIAHGAPGTDVRTDIDANGVIDEGGLITADADDLSLAGDVDFHDGSTHNPSDPSLEDNFTGTRMTGGNSDNVFQIGNSDFASIDGGNGFDTIKFAHDGDSINLGMLKFEQIQNIEEIDIGNGTITLTAENIFNLLKTNNNGDLRISGDGTVNIDVDGLLMDPGASNTDTRVATDVTGALNKQGTGADYIGDDGEHYHYQIGGYDLYIDNDVTAINIV